MKHESWKRSVGAFVIMLAMGAGGGVLGQAVRDDSVPVVSVAHAESIAPKRKLALIEVHIEWTQERIKQEIREVFPEQPELMVKVASCEGVRDGLLDPAAFNPTNGSNDAGIFQISQLYHGEKMRHLALDPLDPADNIAYARLLYDASGLTPWRASKACWGR